MTDSTFRPAWFVRGPHLQTLWAKFARPRPGLELTRERLEMPDGDFVDLWHVSPPGAAVAVRPRLVLLHGLEGTIDSPYVGAFFSEAIRRGWNATLLVFRGCGDEPNRLPRFYHSGETTDLAFVVKHLLGESPKGEMVLAGVSLGGNVLLKWLGEQGAALPAAIRAAGTISVPYDLERGARHLQRGFARVYDRHFLRTLKIKAREKLSRFPGIFSSDALDGARFIYDFDDVVTAPLHGFANAHDYYSRSSSLGFVGRIRCPTMMLSARDDPFLPSDVLEDVAAAIRGNDCVNLEIADHGGHVGFVGGGVPWRAEYYAERRICDFLERELKGARSARIDTAPRAP